MNPVAQRANRQRRRSLTRAANGVSQATYQGSSELVVTSRAAVIQPVAATQSSRSRHTSRISQARTATNTEPRARLRTALAVGNPRANASPGTLCQSPLL